MVLDAEELVHRIIVPLIFFALDLALEEPLQHMGGKTLRGRLSIQRIAAQIGQIAFPPLEDLLLMRGRFIAEFPVMTRKSELFDESKRGKQLRFVEEDLNENLFVKQIQAPWPEPNQIDEEEREQEYHDRHDSQKPFQHALKHGSQ